MMLLSCSPRIITEAKVFIIKVAFFLVPSQLSSLIKQHLQYEHQDIFALVGYS